MEDIKYVFDALAQTYQGKRMDDYKVVVHCPICDENGKPHSHSHCYVGIIGDTHPKVVYHCFMNECSGVVTPQFLRDVGVYDNSLEIILNLFNRTKNTSFGTKKEKVDYYIMKKKEDLLIPDIPDTPGNQYKLNYLRQRLGINFSYENAKQLKIVFSLKDFLELNEIHPNRRYGRNLKDLNNDYIGFLTTSKEFLVCRNTVANKNLRYVKYDIFNTLNTKEIIYVVPGTTADLFANHVDLYIAEGTFDALGLFCNVHHFKRENAIYAACCGSGYINAIKYFIRMGFVGNLAVHVYSDSDKPLEYYRTIKLVPIIGPWVKSIDLYYNTASKDYGVPKQLINIQKAVRGSFS